MFDLFAKRLRRTGFLADDDLRLMERAARIKHVPADRHLVSQGETPKVIHILLSGYTCRYNLLSNGRRQISAILVPGDSCDLHALLLRAMDHSVRALVDCTVAEIPRTTVLEWSETQPRITRALWWVTLADDAGLREWLANVGRQDAKQRISHLFCDLLERLKAVGLAAEDTFEFPLTQEELGDFTGLSTVHVNRTLQELRAQGLISLRGRRLTIHDPAGLRESGGFDSRYLTV